MKKFVGLIVTIVIIAYAGNMLSAVFSTKGKVTFNYSDLHTPVQNYGSMVIMKTSHAFPEKVMDMIVTVAPNLEDDFKQLQIELADSDSESGIMSPNNLITPLRKAEKIVTAEEYFEIIMALGQKIKNKISAEDPYKLWKSCRKDCEALRKIIPNTPKLMKQHAIMCHYFDDIEQLENYLKHHKKDDDKEREEGFQEMAKSFIGDFFIQAMLSMTELMPLFEEAGINLNA